jgi:hypothetical protein
MDQIKCPSRVGTGALMCLISFQLLALDKFGTVIGLSFAFPFCLVTSPITRHLRGRRYKVSELGIHGRSVATYDIDHPVRHLHRLHCDEKTKWGERGDCLPRSIAILTQVTSTIILIVAVAQRWGADYIYQWVSSMYGPWLLLESAVTHLKTLVQNIC